MRAELGNTAAAVTKRCCDAVRACVAAADDNNVLVFCRQVVAVLETRIQQALDGSVQIVHRIMNALEVTSLNIEFTRFCCTAAQYDGIVVFHQSLGGNVFANLGVDNEFDAFRASKSTRR